MLKSHNLLAVVTSYATLESMPPIDNGTKDLILKAIISLVTGLITGLFSKWFDSKKKNEDK